MLCFREKFHRGMTLVEILIVIGVIAVLSSFAVGYYQEYLDDARRNVQLQNANIVREAISRYFKDNLEYPTSLEKLQGPYIHQPISSLFDASGAYTVMVQVTNVAEENLYHVGQQDRIWVPYTFGGNTHDGKQIGDIKIVSGSVAGAPYVPVDQGDDTQIHDDGGTDYVIHVYSSVGSQNFDVPSGVSQVDLLIVGGGGGGGTSTSFSNGGSGGGGSGGLVYAAGVATVNPSYTIVVGAGGSSAASGNVSGQNGSNSSAFGLTALGGGGGIGGNGNGLPGGSGGGGRGGSGGAGQQPGSASGGSGNSGGNCPGSPAGAPAAGGGGAGGAAANIAGNAGEAGGNGGVGVDYSSFAGIAVGQNGWFAGGGGGGAAQNLALPGSGGQGGGGTGGRTDTASTAGLAGTGGGGGGGNNDRAGASGGSGIVIIRYAVP